MEPLRNYVKDYAVFGKQKKLEHHLHNVKPHPDTPTEAGTTLLHEALVHARHKQWANASASLTFWLHTMAHRASP